MNPEIKAQWLRDLRSGEYAQAKGALKTTDGYCCLGVLCEQAVRAGVAVHVGYQEFHVGSHMEYASAADPDDSATGLLPCAVVEWAGLSHSDPSARGKSLASLNDRGEEFTAIADLIGEYL